MVLWDSGKDLIHDAEDNRRCLQRASRLLLGDVQAEFSLLDLPTFYQYIDVGLKIFILRQVGNLFSVNSYLDVYNITSGSYKITS